MTMLSAVAKLETRRTHKKGHYCCRQSSGEELCLCKTLGSNHLKKNIYYICVYVYVHVFVICIYIIYVCYKYK